MYRGQKLMTAVSAKTAAIISNTVAVVPLIKSRKYRTTMAAAIRRRMILSAVPIFDFIQKLFCVLQNCNRDVSNLVTWVTPDESQVLGIFCQPFYLLKKEFGFFQPGKIIFLAFNKAFGVQF